MTQRIIITALLVAFLAGEADAQNRRYRRRGTILGGLAGAAIGAAIGDKGDNETAGALIGGAVGAIAGGTIGNQKDQRIEHYQRYHSGHAHPSYYTQPGYHYGGNRYLQPGYPAYRQPAYPHPLQYGVTVADILAMRQRGLSDATMIRLIQTHGIAAKPTVGEVIDMHEQGVSEQVIAAMQGDPVSVGDYPLPVTEYPLETTSSPTAEVYGPSIVAPAN